MSTWLNLPLISYKLCSNTIQFFISWFRQNRCPICRRDTTRYHLQEIIIKHKKITTRRSTTSSSQSYQKANKILQRRSTIHVEVQSYRFSKRYRAQINYFQIANNCLKCKKHFTPTNHKFAYLVAIMFKKLKLFSQQMIGTAFSQQITTKKNQISQTNSIINNVQQQIAVNPTQQINIPS